MQPMTTKDINRTIGQNIRRLRWANTTFNTLQQLGNKLGISGQQFQKYETGVNRISLVTAVETAKLFGVSIEAFCTELGLPEKSLFPTSGHEQKLVESFRLLDAAMQRRIVEEFEQLAAHHRGRAKVAA